MLISHIRNKNKQPFATLVAIPVSDNKFSINYSMCHKNLDVFDKKKGIEIAKKRALTRNYTEQENIPMVVQNYIPKFLERCSRYFKNRTLV